MRILILVFSVFMLQNSSLAQSQSFENQLLERVNLLRDSLELKPLKLDVTLSEAAFDHAFYMAANRKLTHYQQTFTKETPAERIEHYGGNRTYSGENVAQTKLTKDSTSQKGITALAETFFNLWFHSPGHYANMVNSDFTKMGLSFQVATSKDVYAAQVFSSNEITLPKEFKNPERSWGVRPAEFDCKDETQTYNTMQFADGVSVSGKDIYFYYHDVTFFNNVIRSENDGLAVDIILREQLPCNKENQFHISDVYDGNMLKPVYKMDILRNDVSGNSKKIYSKIGELPDYLVGKEWQPNIIIINDNKLCDYSVPVTVPHDIFPLLLIDPYYDESDSTEILKEVRTFPLKDTLTAELWYRNRDKTFSYLNENEFLNISALGPFVHKTEVECNASVNGATWYNLELLEHRTQAAKELLGQYGFSHETTQYSSAENWNLMQEQISEHGISALQRKTNGQIKSYLKRNKNQFFDSLLFEQRKTKITAYVDTYRRYLLGKKYGLEISMDSIDWNTILREEYILSKNSIQKELIDSLMDSEILRTNLLGAASIKQVNTNLDSLLVERFVKQVDDKNPKQVFNYAHFLTKYWFSRYAYSISLEGSGRTMDPEELRDLIYELDLTEIDSTDYLRLEINTLLAGIHYYVNHNNWSYTNEYFERIAELVQLDGFSPQEAVELALFCNHFHKFKLAIKILRPFHDEAILPEDGYFVLAQTASLIRKTLEKEEYWAFMNSAKRANEQRYCLWLDTDFQIQRDEYIKSDFCKTCK